MHQEWRGTAGIMCRGEAVLLRLLSLHLSLVHCCCPSLASSERLHRSAGVSSCADGAETRLWLQATERLAVWCQHSVWYRGERASFPADPLVFCLIGWLYSLSIPLLWQVLNSHSHLSPRSLQVKCEIHLFQGRNQSTRYPVTDRFVCSSK